MQAVPRNNVVKARVLPDEKRALLAAASRRCLTLSQLIREAIGRSAGAVVRTHAEQSRARYLRKREK